MLNNRFSLDELRSLLPSDLMQWDHHSLVQALRGKIRDIEAMQRRLTRSKAQLREVLSEIEAKPEDMDCASNAERVLSQFGLAAPAAASSRENGHRQVAGRSRS